MVMNVKKRSVRTGAAWLVVVLIGSGLLALAGCEWRGGGAVKASQTVVALETIRATKTLPASGTPIPVMSTPEAAYPVGTSYPAGGQEVDVNPGQGAYPAGGGNEAVSTPTNPGGQYPTPGGQAPDRGANPPGGEAGAGQTVYPPAGGGGAGQVAYPPGGGAGQVVYPPPGSGGGLATPIAGGQNPALGATPIAPTMVEGMPTRAPESGTGGPNGTPAPTGSIGTPTPTRVIQKELLASDPSKVQLASGKYQLIEFFAFWDGLSQAQTALMHRLEAVYGLQVNFIYLDVDNPANQRFKVQLGYKRQPEFFLVDPRGSIVQHWSGQVDEMELGAALAAVIKK